MFGKGIITGMGITLKHFFDSYKADRRRGLGTRYLPHGEEHQGPVKGFVTVQYPEEKLKVPENFRFMPFLIKDDVTGEDWCTACGICARVCPPQCIWIVRAKKDDGKPMPVPEGFWIDTSICMQCGYCAEYCPFDAIKMDHIYDIPTQERWDAWIFDKEKLTKPNSYYMQTHPRQGIAEKAVRDEKEAKKAKGGRASKEAKAESAAKTTPTPKATPAANAAPTAPGKSETVKANPAMPSTEQKQATAESRADVKAAQTAVAPEAQFQNTGPAAEQKRPADEQSIATATAESRASADPNQKEDPATKASKAE